MPKDLSKIVEQKNEMPALELRASIAPESVNKEEKTVRVQYTTGERVYRPSTWFSEEYYEELATAPGNVRLDRLKAGAVPALNSHSSWSLDAVMGRVIDADETHATIKFSDRDELQGFWRDIESGIIRNVSVGYRVYKYEDITEEDNKIRVLRAIDWEPIEISFVAIGADKGAGVRSESTVNKCVILGAKPTNQEERKMPGENKKDGFRDDENLKTREGNQETETQTKTDEPETKNPESKPENEGERKDSVESQTQEAILAERKRSTEIRDIVRSLDLDEALADTMIKRGDTVEQARAAVIAKMAKKDEETEIKSNVRGGGQDEVLTRRAAIEQFLLHRHNPGKNELKDAATEYRGFTLLDVARELVGHRECRGLNKMEIVRRAFHSTSDFTEILANVASKSLRQAYMDTKRTFMPFSRQISLPDFKEMKRVALSNAPHLEQVVEGGEYKRGTFTEGAETIQLMTYGKIVGVTRQAIINDDLDAFTRVPAKMAAAAGRLENRMVYDILTTNAALADGTELFHADHGNLTDALLGVDGIGAIRALMRTQTDPSGNDVLNIEPAYLIVPAALETAAAKLKASLYADSAANTNPFSNTFDIIVEGYLDGASTSVFYMAASPNEIDTIEYGYLDGEVGPYLESRDGFDTDGIEFKVRHDFAAKPIDHRGLAKSTNDAA